MASLTKDSRGRSPYWIACYASADGRRLKKSTKTADRRKAQAIADAWEGVEAQARGGTLTELQVRNVIAETLERVTGKKPFDPTVREWLEHWTRGEEGTVQPGTLAKYRRVAKTFLKRLGRKADQRLETVTAQDVLEFRRALLDEGRAPGTVNDLVRGTLSLPFNLAQKQGLIRINPTRTVKPLQDARPVKGTFSPEQVAALLRAAPDADWRGLILAGWYTGARIHDLTRLKWSNVDLASNALAFRQTKTGGDVVIPLHPQLLEHLLSLPAPLRADLPLFPTLHDLPKTGTRSPSLIFKRLMQRAGIEAGTNRTRRGKAGRSTSRLSFHSFRHSFNSALANSGVPQELRQKLTGHRSAETNALYLHHDLEAIREAVCRLPGLKR